MSFRVANILISCRSADVSFFHSVFSHMSIKLHCLLAQCDADLF